MLTIKPDLCLQSGMYVTKCEFTNTVEIMLTLWDLCHHGGLYTNPLEFINTQWDSCKSAKIYANPVGFILI